MTPRRTVITCAVTGSFDTVAKNPAVPVSPEQIANSALDASKAGAAVVHIHVRDPVTGKASMDIELYRETYERIRDKNEDVLINLTTGAGARYIPDSSNPAVAGAGANFVSPAERLRHVELLGPEICSLDVGSMNFGEAVMVNTPAHLREMAARANSVGTKPEIEVFELGHIELAKKMLADGNLARPPLFQLCLGISYGAPATPDVLIAMRGQLPDDAIWSAFGVGPAEFPMVALAASLGGNVRVGLEDNLYLSRGELAPSNAALVEKAVKILDLIGHKVAGPAEARDLFAVQSDTGAAA